MAKLKPEIGLVIRHAYLWWSETRKGRTTEVNRFIWPGPDLRPVPY